MSKAAELAKMGEVITNSQLSGRRNIVINGGMNVAQRSVSVAALGDGDEGYVTLDRIRHTAAASAGRFTSAQTAISDLPGFLNCLHLDCTTADTSIAATELLVLEHRIEGQDLQQLKKGTSDAEKVTVSFYMKTNAAFVFMCVLNDFDNNRVNTQKFTTTTGWTRHSITFAGDTTGALGDDNALSLSVSIYLHAGSNFTGGTYVSNAWQSRSSSDNMIAPGIGSFYSNTSNDVKLTGLQLEVGSVATPFENRSFGEELALCQRYFTKEAAASGAAYKSYAMGQAATTTVARCSVFLPTSMRSTPTLVLSGNVNTFAGNSAGGSDACTAIALSGDGDAGTDNVSVSLNVTVGSGYVAGDAVELLSNNNTSTHFAFDAEI